MISVTLRRRMRRTWTSILCILVSGLSSVTMTTAGTETYEYDELGRLKKVTYVNGTSSTFSLDAAGNRTGVTTASSSQPTHYAITTSNGVIVPAASSLYQVENSCSGGTWHTACTWLVRKKYGNYMPVIVVVRAPDGAVPACTNGTTQQVSSGYTRSVCALSATAAVYGN
jgi:YD repeat-containing protein